MTEPNRVRILRKNSREHIVVALNRYREVDLVDIRVYAETGEDADMVPTKKGIAFKPALLPELIEALQLAEAECRLHGLLGAQ